MVMGIENEGVVADEQAADSPPQDASSEMEKLMGEEAAEGESAEGEAQESEEEGEAAEEGAEQEAEEEGAESEDDKPKGHRNEKVEKRIAELTAARKAAEETAAEAQKRAEALESQAGAAVGLHPSYVTKDEAAILEEARTLEARQEELLKNLDGIESDDPKKSMTAEQVRTEYARVSRKVLSVVGKAEAIYERAMKQQMEDMKAGQELRAKKSKLQAPPATPQKRKLMPPAAPARGLAGTPPVSSAKKTGMDEARFEKAGADRKAAAAELENLVGD
jgi:hypothetical protein